MVKIGVFLQKSLIRLVKIYQFLLSPFFGSCCRFYPSCSQYGLEAITRYGIISGMWRLLKRISCCHPWHPGGYDPLSKTSHLSK